MSNAYALHALESTYGTVPSTGWREVEVDSDSFKTKRDVQQRKGLRRDSAAPRLSGRRITDKGAEGSIDIVAATNGLGPFLACAASTATSTLVTDATDAYEQVFTWTSAGPPLNRSLSTEVYRDRQSGTLDAYTYSGGRVTTLELGQGLDGWLTMKFAMDYLHALLQPSNPGRTPVEVDPALLYNWEDPLITLTPKGLDPEDDGNTECLSNFGLTLPTNVDVEKWCLKRGTGKHEPVRKGTPEPVGTLAWDYEHPRYYTAFVDQAPFTLSAVWQSPVEIETGIYPSFTIDIPTLVFTGEDPSSSPDESTKQSMPFAVVDDDSGDPVVTITQVTSDTAL